MNSVDTKDLAKLSPILLLFSLVLIIILDNCIICILAIIKIIRQEKHILGKDLQISKKGNMIKSST